MWKAAVESVQVTDGPGAKSLIKWQSPEGHDFTDNIKNVCIYIQLLSWNQARSHFCAKINQLLAVSGVLHTGSPLAVCCDHALPWPTGRISFEIMYKTVVWK